MNSDSMTWMPSRCEQLCPVGPTSVIPVWSKHEAPYADSIAARVAGMLAPGSPAWIVTRNGDKARSTPRPRPTSAIRSAYVGVESSTVASRSRRLRTRCSVVIPAPESASAPNRSAPPNADQNPMKGPNENAKKIRSPLPTPAARYT